MLRMKTDQTDWCLGVEADLSLSLAFTILLSFEPPCEKTGLWDSRPGPKLTRLYNHT